LGGVVKAIALICAGRDVVRLPALIAGDDGNDHHSDADNVTTVATPKLHHLFFAKFFIDLADQGIFSVVGHECLQQFNRVYRALAERAAKAPKHS